MRDEAFEGRPEALKVVLGDGTSGLLDKERDDAADVVDGPRRKDEPCHVSAIENLADAREGLIAGHTFASIQFGGRFVDQWFGPVEVVLDCGHEVGNGHGHRLLERGKMAGLDLGFQPPLLFGRELDRHAVTLAQSEV